MRGFRSLLLIGTLTSLELGALAVDHEVATYTATYEVEYKGKNVGTSEFSVRHLADAGLYEFNSRTVAKGLLKLVSPHPATERSSFRVDGDRIVPLEFWFEDGSRKGEDNLHIVFDWQRNIATVSGEDGQRELEVGPGVLDRGSIQVALMRDLAVKGEPGRYRMADDDSVTDYVYMDNGEAVTETGIGKLATRGVVQHREGSSRTTYLWLAPELKFLPVRIEQHRNGELQTAFTLTSVTGLE